MPLISIIIVLIVIGLLLYIVESLLPIDATIKMIIRVVILLAVIIWLLGLVGVLPHDLRVGYLARMVLRC